MVSEQIVWNIHEERIHVIIIVRNAVSVMW